jgi:predicted methyltransferase
MKRVVVALAGALVLAGCVPQQQPELPVVDAGEAVAPGDPAALAVAAPDRSSDDRALDEGRRPAELLSFFAIEPGMHVAELGAGGGYTTELLARAVGPTGVIYAQNDPWVLENVVGGPWTERLEKPIMANVVRLDRAFDDPFPAEIGQLDAVVIVLFYHDTVWLHSDRDRMNRAVFAALKPGGIYCIVDHSAWPGHGTDEAESLHRIDEKVVRSEVERAGFELVDQAFFLRNPDDTRDWSTSPRSAGERRGTSDRFVLKFAKSVGATSEDAQ